MASHRIRPGHLKRFRRKMRELNGLLAEIREYEPDANYYLDDDSMCLMVGQSHGDDGRFQPDLMAASEVLYWSGGGGQ